MTDVTNNGNAESALGCAGLVTGRMALDPPNMNDSTSSFQGAWCGWRRFTELSTCKPSFSPFSCNSVSQLTVGRHAGHVLVSRVFHMSNIQMAFNFGKVTIRPLELLIDAAPVTLIPG